MLCVVNFKEYSTEKKTISSNSYYDLLDVEVKCPSKGAMKNFAIKKDSSKVWYDFSCYSSLTDANEYDESILKDLYKTEKETFKYKSSQYTISLARVNFECPVDYALNSFTLTKDSSSYLVMEYGCIGVKTKEQTKDNTILSDSIEGESKSLTPLAGLNCGDKTIETEDTPGTPLRGFKFIVTNLSNGNVKVQYGYSYHKLRSIEKEKKTWASRTEALRNSNTQKN